MLMATTAEMVGRPSLKLASLRAHAGAVVFAAAFWSSRHFAVRCLLSLAPPTLQRSGNVCLLLGEVAMPMVVVAAALSPWRFRDILTSHRCARLLSAASLPSACFWLKAFAAPLLMKRSCQHKNSFRTQTWGALYQTGQIEKEQVRQRDSCSDAEGFCKRHLDVQSAHRNRRG